jgi:chorismate synthase
MSQSSFGKKFVVTTWGESHGKAIGAGSFEYAES